jgi:hypothetical protein
MMLALVGVLLAGALCLAWSSTATGRSQRRRLTAAEAMWVIAGLLAVSTVVIAVLDLCTGALSTPAVGNSVAAIFTGSTCAAAAVGLLGYVGVWARMRRHGRPAPDVGDAERGDHGEWVRVAHHLPAARIDLAYPRASMDPLRIFDHDR